MKRIPVIVLCAAVFLAALSGCGQKAAERTEFEKVMEEESFDVTEMTGQYAAWNVLYAAEGTNESGTEVLFCRTADAESAEELYEFLLSGVKIRFAEASAESESAGKNTGKYTAVTDTECALTAFRDGTLLLCAGKAEDAALIRKIARLLGF